MIAQHEIALRRHHNFRIRPRVGVGGRNVIFIESFAVDIDLATIDADAISGDANYALDVALRGITRIAKHDYVAARNRLQAVDELVDEDALLVGERGHHAGAFDLHWLVNEYDDECRDRERENQIAKPYC